MPTAPLVLLMGTVAIDSPQGDVEPTRRARLTELAAIIATHPGCDHTTIDDAYYPGVRVSDNTRNTQVCKLRRWLGRDASGADYLPRYQLGAGYRLHAAVRTDWDVWRHLLPSGPTGAPTEALETALSLVRGRPFDGVRPRRYAWSEWLKQHMVTAIADTSYELAHRRLMEGRWLAAEEAALTGLMVEPGVETLWRLRLLSIHARGHRDELHRATHQLRTLAQDWGGDLEPETSSLLEQLDSADVRRDAYRLHLV